MKVFLAGATGVLGRRLVRLLHERGHHVVALARTDEKARWLESQGAEARQVSLFDADALSVAADGCSAVIHAATSIPQKARPSCRDWAENDRIRREGTHALVRSAATIGARTYIQQSVVWVARPPDGAFFDEESPIARHPLMQSAQDGERIATEMGQKCGFDVSVLRCGWFYGADAAHTQMFRDGLRKRRIPIIGNGDALWSCLHLDDAATAFLAAIEQPKTGIWHVVDDQPVAVRDFLNEFARQLNAKPPRRVPAWLARLLAGRQAVEFFAQTTQTSNNRFCRNFPWKPSYSTFRDGLAEVAGRWKTDGH